MKTNCPHCGKLLKVEGDTTNFYYCELCKKAPTTKELNWTQEDEQDFLDSELGGTIGIIGGKDEE